MKVQHSFVSKRSSQEGWKQQRAANLENEYNLLHAAASYVNKERASLSQLGGIVFNQEQPCHTGMEREERPTPRLQLV